MSQLQSMEGSGKAVRKSASDYQRDFRKQIAGKKCACSRPAARNKNGEFICQLCSDLEEEAKRHYVVAAQQMRVEKIMKPFSELCEITRRRLTAKSYSEKMAENDRGENRFIASVRDIENELVVFGHGEYHMKVA